MGNYILKIIRYFKGYPINQGRWKSSKTFNMLCGMVSSECCRNQTGAHRCSHWVIFATTWSGYWLLWKSEQKLSWIHWIHAWFICYYPPGEAESWSCDFNNTCEFNYALAKSKHEKNKIKCLDKNELTGG